MAIRKEEITTGRIKVGLDEEKRSLMKTKRW
jgi:hypothetical protein